MKKILLKIMSILMVIALTIPSYSKNSKKKELTKNYFAFDTIVNVSLYDYVSENDAINCLDEIGTMLHDYEKLFSATDKNSQTYKYNKKEIKEKDLDVELKKVIATASEINKLSNGAFDIHIRKLIELWDVKNRKSLPTKNEIETAKKDKYEIDLGSIAKGYVGDKIKEFLIDNEIKSAIITLGGNVVCIGNKAGKKFNIGIEFPFEEEKLIDAVEVDNKAVVTSGIYQRYFKVKNDDKIYSHIINPKTGYPIDNDLYSVTIIADNSELADALSTACMVLGYDKACKFLDNAKTYYNTDIKAVFVNNKLEEKKY